MSISVRKKWSPNNGFDMLILSAAYAIHLETYGFNMVKFPQVTSRAFADGSRLKMTELLVAGFMAIRFCKLCRSY